eukprot:3510331-Amphidinium_carterae.1
MYEQLSDNRDSNLNQFDALLHSLMRISCCAVEQELAIRLSSRRPNSLDAGRAEEVVNFRNEHIAFVCDATCVI